MPIITVKILLSCAQALISVAGALRIHLISASVHYTALSKESTLKNTSTINPAKMKMAADLIIKMLALTISQLEKSVLFDTLWLQLLRMHGIIALWNLRNSMRNTNTVAMKPSSLTLKPWSHAANHYPCDCEERNVIKRRTRASCMDVPWREYCSCHR